MDYVEIQNLSTFNTGISNTGNRIKRSLVPISNGGGEKILNGLNGQVHGDLKWPPTGRAEIMGDLAGDPSVAWKLTGESYLNGPDQILPSEAVRTSEVDGATRILKSSGGSEDLANLAPISIPGLLRRTAERAPDTHALAVKRNGEWKKWTFVEYLRDVRIVAKGLIAMGLERFHSTCIIGFNSPEWFFSALGAIHAGGFATGVYATNSPDACAFVAVDSRANLFVVEDESQLKKVLQIRHQLPHLKGIVQYSGEVTHPGVLSWSDLMELGRGQDDCILEERLRQISINQCCILIYTSGTTGNPKGVMMNHDNITFTAAVQDTFLESIPFKEEIVSFLPMSHVAAMLSDIVYPIHSLITVFFADKNAFKGTLIETMREVQPTIFFAVPRLWEKFYEKMQEVARSTKGLKKSIATFAKNEGLQYNLRKMAGDPNPETWAFRLADKFVLSKVRAALGFSRCHFFICGAAPISPEILKYFMSLNIPIVELFGMSETSGPHTSSKAKDIRIGSVGTPMPGCSVKILDENEEGNGEVLLKGRNVCMGYLNQQSKTMEALDEQGWLHSGDVGRMDGDGYLFITGRLKEILITAGGENIAPVPIEERIKQELPIVSHVVVVGDQLKHLSALLTLKAELNLDTQEPQQELMPFTKEWAKTNGECHVDTINDFLHQLNSNENSKLGQAIQDGIDRVNSKAVSNAQKIQKWRILPLDFSLPGGELGPTLKLKRQIVYTKYKETIKKIYCD